MNSPNFLAIRNLRMHWFSSLLLLTLILLMVTNTPLPITAAPLAQEDTTPPSLTSSTPADGAIDVPVNSTLTFTFDEAVVYFNGDITLECPQATAIAFSVGGDETNTLTLTPNASLPAATTCTWAVATIADLAFNQIAQPVSGSFTTAGGGGEPTPTATAINPAPTATPTTQPSGLTIISVTPADGTTNVAIDTSITFKFSAQVYAYNDAQDKSFTLACPTGAEIQYTVTNEGTPSDTVTIVPAANLPAGVTCTWQINGNALFDINFNRSTLQGTGSFTTKAGGTDPNPDPGNSSIQRIEVNQAMGVQLNNELNFVANKPTVIRAFLKTAVTVNAQQTSVKVIRDGQTVTTLQPKSTDRPELIIDFLCPNLAACDNWAAGKYVFEVTVNGDTRSTQGTIYEFKERQGMRILAVAVRVKYGTQVQTVTDERWRTAYQFLSKTYPVAPSRVNWIVGNELDATAHDINTSAGRQGVWRLLAGLQPNNCVKQGQTGAGTPCFDKILGFIPTNPRNGNQSLAGYTYGSPANVVVSTDVDMVVSVAHEIGHNYQLGDTYNDGAHNCRLNPPPDEYRGVDFYTRKPIPNGCQAGKTKGRGDGTNIPANHNPYDVTERGRLPDMTSYMAGGDGTPPTAFWTTQEAYSVVFKGLAPTQATPATIGEALLNIVASAQIAPVRVIDFFGFISKDDQVELAPSFIDESETRIPSTTGEYMAAAVNSSGDVLTSMVLDIFFDQEFDTTDGREYVELDEVPFGGIMEFPDGAAKLQIRKGETVLAEVDVSANAPTVQVTAPTAGQTLDGEFTIEWTADDADGDELSYVVEYNPDVTNPESDWYVLAADITETSWAEDFSFLPGGDNAQIIVTAGDGVLSSEGVSAQFKVPAQAPDIYIYEPEGGYSYAVGDDVKLEADAYDAQLAEFIPDTQILWRSDIDGDLGSGAILITTGLSEGTHTITVEATDSKSAKVMDEIELYVGNISSQYIAKSTTGDTTITNSFLGRNVALTVPATLSANDTYVDLVAYQTPISETPPAGFLFADRFFALYVDELVNEEWQAITTTNAGVILTVSYGTLPDSIDPATLRIHHFDEETESWIDAATECSPASTYDRSVAGQLSVPICHFSEYALTGTTSSATPTIYLPLIQR